MNLESPKVTVEKSAEYLFNSLSDVRNFEKLMPDTIAKFEVTGDDSFIFGLKGMPEIKLRMKEKNPSNQVILGAASEKLPIMVFVGNRGNIQIHTGIIKKTMWHGSWFNVMDPDFNLHLDMNQVAQTWIVRKPTQDGVVTAVEVFNAQGEIIVQFFGKRKPGIPELEAWRNSVGQLK